MTDRALIVATVAMWAMGLVVHVAAVVAGGRLHRRKLTQRAILATGLVWPLTWVVVAVAIIHKDLRRGS